MAKRKCNQLLKYEDMYNMTSILSSLMDVLNNQDESLLTYKDIYKMLDNIKRQYVIIDFEEYIDDETVSYLNHIVDNDLTIDEYTPYEYSNDQIDFQDDTKMLLDSFEYSDLYWDIKKEYQNYYSPKDMDNDIFYHIKKIRAFAIEDRISNIYNKYLSQKVEYQIPIDEIENQIDYMKIANYIDGSLYEKELEK